MRDKPLQNQPGKRSLVLSRLGIALAASVPALIVCALVGGKVWSIGVRGEWTWPFREQAALWGWALAPAAVFAVLSVCVWQALRRDNLPRRKEAIFVALLFAASLGLFYAVPFVDSFYPYQEEAVTAFPWAGGYYTEAVFVEDPLAYLQTYPQLISALSVEGPLGHIANHPPGPVLFHWALNRAAASSPSLQSRFLPTEGEAAELLGLAQGWAARAFAERPVVPGAPPGLPTISKGEFAGLFMASHAFRFLAALTVVPVYFLGRMLGGRRAAVFAAALAALIPSLHAFSPFLDQLFCPVAAFCLLFTAKAMSKKSLGWASVAGVTLHLGMQFTLAFLAIAAVGFVFGVVWVLDEWRDQRCAMKWAPWASVFGAALAGFLAPLAALHLLVGYDSLRVWWICYVQHAGFSELFSRTYWPWFFAGPLEFAVFMGVPLAALTAGAVCRNALAWRAGGERLMPLLWSVLVVLAVLTISGKNRGETARLWMVFMPLLAVPAGRLLARIEPRAGAATAIVLASMFVQTLVFRGALEVLKIG